MASASSCPGSQSIRKTRFRSPGCIARAVPQRQSAPWQRTPLPCRVEDVGLVEFQGKRRPAVPRSVRWSAACSPAARSGNVDIDEGLRSQLLDEGNFSRQIRRTLIRVRSHGNVVRADAENDLACGACFDARPIAAGRKSRSHGANHGAASIRRQGPGHHVHRRGADEGSDEDVDRTVEDLQRRPCCWISPSRMTTIASPIVMAST